MCLLTMYASILFMSWVLPDTVSSIRCFECHVVEHPDNKPKNITQNLCDRFDYTEKFIKDCGNSTFCVKAVVSEQFFEPYGRVVGIQRNCANQGTLLRKYWPENDTWDYSYILEDVYMEGCSVVDSLGLRTARIENCYCKTDLCNSERKVSSSVMLIVTFLVCASLVRS